MNRAPLRTCLLLGVSAVLTACPSDDDGSESGQSGTESTSSTTTTDTDPSTTTTDTDSTTTSTSSTSVTATDGSTGGTGSDTDTEGSTGAAADCGPPAELGVYAPTDGNANGFAVDGDTLYVAGEGGGIYVADIADPTAISELGVLDLGPGRLVYRVAVSGTNAFLALRGNGYSIVDVSNPAMITEIASDDSDDARDIAVAGNVMYFPDNTGLVVYDVTNPAAPVEMANDLVLAGSTESIVLDGDTAYVGSTGAGLLIVDVSAPDAPVEVGHYDVMGNGFVSIDGDLAFVSTGDGVHVVDISTPATPMMVAQYGDRAHSSAADSGRLFLLGSDTATTDVPFLSIVDISDPANPVEEFTAFDTFEDPAWLGFDGTRLMFSAEDDDSVHIIDPCPPV